MSTSQSFVIHDIDYSEKKQQLKLVFSLVDSRLENKNLTVELVDSVLNFVLYKYNASFSKGIDYWAGTDNLPYSKYFSFIIKHDNDVVFKHKFNFSEAPCFDIFNKIPCLLNYFQHKQSNLDLSIVKEIFFTESYSSDIASIKEGDTVVDIGSNVGLFIYYALQKKAGQIFSCEPNSKCFKILQDHFGTYSNIILNKYAIAKTSGQQDLVILNEISGANFILNNENAEKCEQNQMTETVNTLSFLDFIKLNNIDFIDFLKIDCEGGEYDIFVDANKHFLTEKTDKIILEYHGSFEKIEEFLNKNNFSNKRLSWNGGYGMIYAKNNRFASHV